MNFTVNTKAFIKGLELSALKGKYFSSVGLKNASLSDSASLNFNESLQIFNGNPATALCITVEAEVENSGHCIIPIKKTVDYLKKMGDSCEISVGELFVIVSDEKRVQLPVLEAHEAAGFIGMFRNQFSEYTMEDEEISFGKAKIQYETITNVYASVFAESLNLCEITNSGVYRLDMMGGNLTISSENGTEKFATNLATVNQKQEDATVEFTAPLHKLFQKDETIKICFNDDSPIFIIGENASIVRAPYVNV